MASMSFQLSGTRKKVVLAETNNCFLTQYPTKSTHYTILCHIYKRYDVYKSGYCVFLFSNSIEVIQYINEFTSVLSPKMT